MSSDEGKSSPNVLEYLPEARRASSSVAATSVLMTPVFVGIGVNAMGFSELALPSMLAAAIGMYLYRRHDRSVPHVVLRVEGGVLHLSGRRYAGPSAVRLDYLYDVILDTRTVERVQEKVGGMPELRFIDSTVASAVDEARIELETSDGSVFLTEHRLSHLDATEWSNKIRRFLRRNGWVPEDERPES